MQYTGKYKSPFGSILLAADETGLTGLWFEGQKYFADTLDPQNAEKELPVLIQARQWLDIYFSGKEPEFQVPLHVTGSKFQQKVWAILSAIPYGQTITYGAVAKQIAVTDGVERVSAQAVGGAVGHNPVSIIIPCHRVVGSNGSLTGYAGGLEKKAALLKLEAGNGENRVVR
ncbi:MAG: methylated-DNA--[protein]-cysteine S-methyltransferase [Lachnospiraceae bacterium]|nr:methylated-DNA--[protein]-cysteine S-methyltransferase [Lachnospiraceae bacterium]